MADPVIAAADAATTGTTTPAGTPAAAPAEAGNSDGVEYWKAEAKRAFEKRDKAIEEFKSSTDFKAVLERAAKADEYEKARAEAERKAAEEKGEYKRLYEEQNAGVEKLKADYEARLAKATQDHADLARKHKSDRGRAALSEAYQAAGGIDLDAFLTLAGSYLDDGSIVVGDDGTVRGHGDVVKAFVEKRGYMFRKPTAEALRMLERHGVRVEEQPGTFAARDAKQEPQKSVSLADFGRSERQAREQATKQRFAIGQKPG